MLYGLIISKFYVLILLMHPKNAFFQCYFERIFIFKLFKSLIINTYLCSSGFFLKKMTIFKVEWINEKNIDIFWKKISEAQIIFWKYFFKRAHSFNIAEFLLKSKSYLV